MVNQGVGDHPPRMEDEICKQLRDLHLPANTPLEGRLQERLQALKSPEYAVPQSISLRKEPLTYAHAATGTKKTQQEQPEVLSMRNAPIPAPQPADQLPLGPIPASQGPSVALEAQYEEKTQGQGGGSSTTISTLHQMFGLDRWDAYRVKAGLEKRDQEILKLGRELNKRDEEISSLRCQIRCQQGTLQGQSRQIHSLESQLITIRGKLVDQEKKLHDAQARVLKNIEGDNWTSGDDSTVRADIEKLYARIKTWAKAHALDAMTDMGDISLARPEMSCLFDALSQVTSAINGTTNNLRFFQTPRMNKKAPVILLQALLADHLYKEIVQKPFFVMDRMTAGTNAEVYNTLLQINPKEAHAWRSKMLRLLTTPLPEGSSSSTVSPTAINTIKGYAAHRSAACYDYTHQLYSSPMKYLLKHSATRDEAESVFKSLELIVQAAGELSGRLWSRKTSLATQGLAELKDVKFKAGSKMLKAHALHKLYDEEDDRCDGFGVRVVVHPAVVGYGSSDGEDYETGRVWMKAEVLLVEKVEGKAEGGLGGNAEGGDGVVV